MCSACVCLTGQRRQDVARVVVDLFCRKGALRGQLLHMLFGMLSVIVQSGGAVRMLCTKLGSFLQTMLEAQLAAGDVRDTLMDDAANAALLLRALCLQCPDAASCADVPVGVLEALSRAVRAALCVLMRCVWCE